MHLHVLLVISYFGTATLQVQCGRKGVADEDEENSTTDGEEKFEGEEPPPGNTSIRVVRKLSQNYFCRKLVEHFDILWTQNKVVWPKRHRSPVTVPSAA
jgi:hypothetical protein